MVDRLILTVTDGVGAVADQLSIKCDLHVDSSAHHGGTISNADVALVEEELRSTILRLSLLDSQLSKPSEGIVLTAVFNSIAMFLTLFHRQIARGL